MQVRVVQKVVVLVVVRGNRHDDDDAGDPGAGAPWYRCVVERHARFREAAGAWCWRYDHAWKVTLKKKK